MPLCSWLAVKVPQARTACNYNCRQFEWHYKTANPPCWQREPKRHLGFSSTSDQLISLLDFQYSHPKRPLLSFMFPEWGCFFHHFPTSTKENFPSLTFFCILALCWTHYWFLKRAHFQPQRLYSSSQLLLCPPQRSISENKIILTLLDNTFYVSELGLKSASFLLGRLTFSSLPIFFPITATITADEMVVQCVVLSFGQIFLMNHHRRRDSCAVSYCAFNACAAPVMIVFYISFIYCFQQLFSLFHYLWCWN